MATVAGRLVLWTLGSGSCIGYLVRQKSYAAAAGLSAVALLLSHFNAGISQNAVRRIGLGFLPLLPMLLLGISGQALAVVRQEA